MKKPGDKMKDGTIYAGSHPMTGDGIYVPENDVTLRLRWQQAVQYTMNMQTGNHRDWRLATEQEMNVIFNNREKGALKKLFNKPACRSGGYDPDDDIYWTAHWKLDQPQVKEAKDFKTGATVLRYKQTRLALLPVRTGPAPT